MKLCFGHAVVEVGELGPEPVKHCILKSSVDGLAIVSVISVGYSLKTRWACQGGRRMSSSRWHEGSDLDHVMGQNWDSRLVGHCKIPAWQRAKLPRYRREGAVEVRPFPAEKRSRASEAQGPSSEAMNGNPTTTAIPGVDESKSSKAIEGSIEPQTISTGPPPFLRARSSRRAL